MRIGLKQKRILFQARELLVDVGEFDPNVPIVMMQAEGAA